MRHLFAALILILVLLPAVSAHADSPIPPHKWERVVGSYRFVMLSPYDQTPQAAEGRRYPASGLYRAEGPAEPLWTIDWYAHEDEVFLSSDVEYLVRMGPWPLGEKFDELAVAFYRNGSLTKSYLVRDLVKNPDALPRSVSHYMWHEGVTHDPEQQRLTVKTIPGITYVFDVTTGEILSPYAGPRGKDWVWAAAWTVAGSGLAVGILILMRRSRRP